FISAQTDATGKYLIAGLAGGSYAVAVSAAGYATALPATLTLGQGQLVLDVSLAAESTRVSGMVRGAGGPLREARVAAFDPRGLPVAVATTAADGTYSFTNLPAGNFTVAAAGNGYLASAPLAVTVPAGGTVAVPDTVLTPVGLSDPLDQDFI